MAKIEVIDGDQQTTIPPGEPDAPRTELDPNDFDPEVTTLPPADVIAEAVEGWEGHNYAKPHPDDIQKHDTES